MTQSNRHATVPRVLSGVQPTGELHVGGLRQWVQADILVYRATVVSVGNDQHLELSREICRKFNTRFGEVFVEPKPRPGAAPRIMGLDGK